jgi:hypothetical protein
MDHAVRVTYADGNHLVTGINGTRKEVESYYLGQFFQFGDSDSCPGGRMVRAVAVEFLGEEE